MNGKARKAGMAGMTTIGVALTVAQKFVELAEEANKAGGVLHALKTITLLDALQPIGIVLLIGAVFWWLRVTQRDALTNLRKGYEDALTDISAEHAALKKEQEHVAADLSAKVTQAQDVTRRVEDVLSRLAQAAKQGATAPAPKEGS